MTVIPFDPNRRRGNVEARTSCRVGAEPEPRHALRAHIALLERTLVQILRENAQNWARAEAAESRLAAFEREAMR